MATKFHFRPSLNTRAATAAPSGIPLARAQISDEALGRRAPAVATISATTSGIPVPRAVFNPTGITRMDPVGSGDDHQEPQSEWLIGMVIDIRRYNDWAIARVVDASGKKTAIKGAAVNTLEENTRYRLKGRRTTHPKYGESFDVLHVEPDVESIEAIIQHIQRNYENAGPVTARKLAEHFRNEGRLEELKEALIHAPSSLDFTPFTNRSVMLRTDAASQLRQIKDSLAIRLGSMGIAQNVFQSLALHLLEKVDSGAYDKERFAGLDKVPLCNALLDENPYIPIRYVDNYGFQTADLVARKVGIERNDPRRIAAIVGHALKTGCEDGAHAWLTEAQLFESIARLDRGVNPYEAIQIAIDRNEPIIIDEESNPVRYYTKSLRHAEQQLANNIADRLTREAKPLFDLDTLADNEQLDDLINDAVKRIGQRKGIPDYTLDESQMEALCGILTSSCSLHTLTAGPGCGKTTIIEVLMELLDRQYETCFCAPTGKAAKVLNGRISRWGQATTIHSALSFNGQWQRNSKNPLDANLVIVDESSMLSTEIGYRLFDAIPDHAHIIMLGDSKQLDPIEPGSVLKAVMSINGLDHHRLMKTHRNDGELLEVINEVGDGLCEVRDRKDVSFYGVLPEPTTEIFQSLASWVKQSAQEYGGLARIGVICPKRRGNTTTPGWNVTYLNAVLRDAINPDPDQTKKVVGTSFRLGDRIIVTKNMHIPGRNLQSPIDGVCYADMDDSPFQDNGYDDVIADFESDKSKVYVVNGDTGVLHGVRYERGEDGRNKLAHLVLRLDDDREVMLPAGELDNLSLSYAITVHAAQGSEYAKVFAVVTDGHEQFMYRSMMFTQFSRAQKELVIFGDQQVLSKVAARPAPNRNCALTERVMREAAEIMGQSAVLIEGVKQRVQAA